MGSVCGRADFLSSGEDAPQRRGRKASRAKEQADTGKMLECVRANPAALYGWDRNKGEKTKRWRGKRRLSSYLK